jgi:hypothetical protein
MCKCTYHSGYPCQISADAIVGIGSVAPRSARIVNFIVDTGSTITLLSPMDVLRFDDFFYDEQGVPFFKGNPLTQVPSPARGGGGGIHIFSLSNAYLTIISNENGIEERHTEYLPEIYVAESSYDLESLMGMDFLVRFKVSINPDNYSVDLTRVPLPGTSYHIEYS